MKASLDVLIEATVYAPGTGIPYRVIIQEVTIDERRSYDVVQIRLTETDRFKVGEGLLSFDAALEELFNTVKKIRGDKY